MRHFLPLLIISAILMTGIESCCKHSAKLEQVTIVSRHGVRVPLEKYMEDLDSIKGPDFSWPIWPVQGSHLSFRGAVLEYMAGEYFGAYFQENNFRLTPGQVYFSASPKQRTVATAHAFAAGLFPRQHVDVSYLGPRDFEPKYLDPEFLPLLNMNSVSVPFDTAAFQNEARREMDELAEAVDIAADLEFLEEKIGFEKSAFASRYHKQHFDPSLTGYNVIFTNGKEPLEPEFKSDSDFKRANRASDALILMYYEQEDAVLDSSQLRGLTFEDWKRLARIKDAYGIVLFTAPIVAVNVSHAMLGNVRTVMGRADKKFNFLCTHDSTMDALLTALQADRSPLPNTIEERTPIGFKIVFEKWRDHGEHYIRPYLAYYSVTQIRASNPADLQGPPVVVNLTFEGLQPAPNGMYRYKEFMQHLDKTYDAFELTAKGQRPF